MIPLLPFIVKPTEGSFTVTILLTVKPLTGSIGGVFFYSIQAKMIVDVLIGWLIR